MLAAPNRLGILAGYTLAALIRAAIVGAMLFAVALATGMRVTGDGVDLFGLLVLALIVNLTATMWAAGWRCGCARSRPARLMQMPVFIVLFLAPVYVPLALLAGWVHAVAQVNPFTALIEGGRDLISGGDVRAGSSTAWRSRCSRRSRSGACAACAGPRQPDSARCRVSGFGDPGEGTFHAVLRSAGRGGRAPDGDRGTAAASNLATRSGRRSSRATCRRRTRCSASTSAEGRHDGGVRRVPRGGRPRQSDRVTAGILARSVQGRPLRYAIVGKPDRVTGAGLAGRARRGRRADATRDTTPARRGGDRRGQPGDPLGRRQRARRRGERHRRLAARALRAGRPPRLRGAADPRRRDRRDPPDAEP